jgi:hypothetical protein
VRAAARALALAAAILVATGCDGESGEDEPVGGRVAVPDQDSSPPSAKTSLRRPAGEVLAEAAQPGDGEPHLVVLDQPRLRGTTVGVDAESGVPRVRVSITEVISCRFADGRVDERRKRLYFPPSQIERIRSSPGARIPVRETRSVVVALGRGRCPRGAETAAVRGELWGDATNGLGLEAVTPHIPFEWRKDRYP